MAWIPVGKNHHASLGTIIIISCEVTLLPSDAICFWIVFIASYQLSFLGELNEYSHWRNTTQSQMKKFEDFILRANKYPSLSIFPEKSNQTTDKKMLLIEVLKLHMSASRFIELYSRIISTWGPQFAVHRANSVASSQGIKFIINYIIKQRVFHMPSLQKINCLDLNAFLALSFFYHQKRICKVFTLLFTCFPIDVFPWCCKHIIIFS